MLKSTVDFFYLCSNGVKVKESYYYEKANVTELVQIECCDMTEEEKTTYLKALTSMNTGSQTHGNDPDDGNKPDEDESEGNKTPNINEDISGNYGEIEGDDENLESGDNTNMWLWGMILLASALGAIIFIYYDKRGYN